MNGLLVFIEMKQKKNLKKKIKMADSKKNEFNTANSFFAITLGIGSWVNRIN